jgi:predicted alpha/beta-hydrolase family hydrolase
VSELYHHAQNSHDGLLILHGGSAGVESSFVQKVFEEGSKTNQNILAYDFPYKVAGAKEPSEGFEDEVPTIVAAIDRLRNDGVTNLHIVAKSVGSAILSSALNRYPDLQISRVTIMGLPIGLTKLEPFATKKLHVVHGEFDRFGNIDAVRAELAKAEVSAEVDEIKGATHSFRDQATDTQPIYEAEAIGKIDFS